MKDLDSPGLRRRQGGVLEGGWLTLSILAAPGRFLGFLVRVTLTKLWKADDLGRKKADLG